MILPYLLIGPTKNIGRGVFTTEDIPADTIIEIAPVILMSADDRLHLDQTLLHDYIFEWKGEGGACCMALGYVPVYNHASPSSCEYEMDYAHGLITVKTVRDIKAGEELFINYNGDWNHPGPVWFDAK